MIVTFCYIYKTIFILALSLIVSECESLNDVTTSHIFQYRSQSAKFCPVTSGRIIELEQGRVVQFETKMYASILGLRGGNYDSSYGDDHDYRRSSQSYDDYEHGQRKSTREYYANDDTYGRRDDVRRTSSPEDHDRYGNNYYSDRYEEDRYYDDRYGRKDDYRDSAPSRPRPKSSSISRVTDVIRKGDKKIGMFLLGGSAVFTLLGISLFFNKSLMRLGNLLLISGVPMTIGPARTVGFFLQPKKARATGCLLAGVFLVMVGWPIFGIALEAFGLLNLFGNMFPMLMIILKQLPFVGSLFGKSNNSRRQEYQRDSDNEEKYY